MAFSIREAANITGKSMDTVRRAIRSNRLPATNTPAGYQIEPADLEAWAGHQTVEANTNLAERLALAQAEIERLKKELQTANQATKEAKDEAQAAERLALAQAANLTDLRLALHLAATPKAIEARRRWFGRREKALNQAGETRLVNP
jgi:excisionase family DNA binding protein